MTFATLAPSRRKARGFTLVEILTVIGILAVLIGILIPVVNGARRAARRKAIQANMQTIATALEAFKSDHGDYPRPIAGQTGATALCQALIGPGDGDGAMGPGIRKATAQGQGRIYGPYLPLDKFPMADTDNASADFTTHFTPARTAYLAMMPRGDNILRPGATTAPYWSPILYYPARPGKRDIRQANAYVAPLDTAMYDFNDNELLFRRPGEAVPPALERMRFVMGDVHGAAPTDPPDGILQANETPRFEGPFILWHPGFDARFGPDGANQEALNNMDDITIFYP